MKVLALAVAGWACGALYGQSADSLTPAAEQALVTKYCAGCHNDKLKSGGFSWNTIDLTHAERNAAQVEKVARFLRAGMMPPPGIPRPDAATNKNFAASLENAID